MNVCMYVCTCVCTHVYVCMYTHVHVCTCVHVHVCTCMYVCMYTVCTCIVNIGGDVYAWGTNSMGQCGQGHSNSSITTPSIVKGLDGIQVQQITTGTSHSLVWTAVPADR